MQIHAYYILLIKLAFSMSQNLHFFDIVVTYLFSTKYWENRYMCNNKNSSKWNEKNIYEIFFYRMKLVIFLFLVSISLTAARSSGKYTDRYDSINVGDVVSNRRLLVPYLRCLLEQGKCSPEGRELKCKYSIFWC